MLVIRLLIVTLVIAAAQASSVVSGDCVELDLEPGVTACVFSDADRPSGYGVSVFGNATSCSWSCPAVSLTGNSTGHVPLSATGECAGSENGNASPCFDAAVEDDSRGYWLAASGFGDSESSGVGVAVTVTGNATSCSGLETCAAVSVTGNATGPRYLRFGGCSWLKFGGHPELCGAPP